MKHIISYDSKNKYESAKSNYLAGPYVITYLEEDRLSTLIFRVKEQEQKEVVNPMPANPESVIPTEVPVDKTSVYLYFNGYSYYLGQIDRATYNGNQLYDALSNLCYTDSKPYFKWDNYKDHCMLNAECGLYKNMIDNQDIRVTYDSTAATSIMSKSDLSHIVNNGKTINPNCDGLKTSTNLVLYPIYELNISAPTKIILINNNADTTIIGELTNNIYYVEDSDSCEISLYTDSAFNNIATNARSIDSTNPLSNAIYINDVLCCKLNNDELTSLISANWSAGMSYEDSNPAMSYNIRTYTNNPLNCKTVNGTAMLNILVLPNTTGNIIYLYNGKDTTAPMGVYYSSFSLSTMHTLFEDDFNEHIWPALTYFYLLINNVLSTKHDIPKIVAKLDLLYDIETFNDAWTKFNNNYSLFILNPATHEYEEYNNFISSFDNKLSLFNYGVRSFKLIANLLSKN